MDVAAKTRCPITPHALTSVSDASASSVLGALAYADLFDYPLTPEEIRRFQVGTSCSGAEIALLLTGSDRLRSMVSREGDFYCLRGREEVFQTRRQRAESSRRVWRRARFYSQWIARMPFVRMVAITGALAVDNISVRPDIDLLIVAGDGRVWICRRLVIGLVRLARLFGDELCPNYIISARNLHLEQQDLFTAHELAQMVPLHGRSIYREMLSRNQWASKFLPEGFDTLRHDVPPLRPGLLRRMAEKALGARMLDRWERWELVRLRGKLRPLVGDAAEVNCSPEQCKGHTGLHRQWVTTRYSRRLSDLGL